MLCTECKKFHACALAGTTYSVALEDVDSICSEYSDGREKPSEFEHSLGIYWKLYHMYVSDDGLSCAESLWDIEDGDIAAIKNGVNVLIEHVKSCGITDNEISQYIEY